MTTIKVTHVAVGIIFNQQQQVLIAKRQAHQEYSDYWEFPGGKQEPGENAYQTLCRELAEEIGISVTKAQAWQQIEHHYPNKKVLLEIWLVSEFHGSAHGKEKQSVKWVAVDELLNYQLLPANRQVVEALIAKEFLGKT